MSEAPTADKLIHTINALKDTEDRDVSFCLFELDQCTAPQQKRDFIKSFRRQIIVCAADAALTS